MDKAKEKTLPENKQGEYFVPCFLYLLQTGSFKQEVINRVASKKTSEGLTSIFIEGCNVCEKDGGYSRISFECLLIFKNILETITQLFNADQLHVLDPFKVKLEGLLNTQNEKQNITA